VNGELIMKKGYKRTDIGVIPKDWEIVTLDELTYKIGDGIHSTPKYSSDGEYFFVNGNNLTDGKIVISKETKKVSKEEFLIHKKVLSNSTILLSINGTIGNIAFYNNEKIVLGKSAAYINLNEKIEKELLYQLLQTEFIEEYFNDELTGSTIKNLGLGSIRNTPIPLPPLPEQKAIAEVLSDTDNLIQALEKRIAKKRQIKQGAMQKLLTPKDDWEVKKLGEICSPSKKRINPITSQLNYKCVELEHISQETGRLIGYTYSKDLKSQKSLFFKNDVLLGKLRPYLKKFLFAEFDGICTTEIWVLKKTINIKSKWLYYLVQSNKIIEVANQSTGTKMPRAEWKVVGDVDVHLPPHSEQTHIATILSEMDSEIKALENKLAKYQQLKQGLMQNLLTGKIRLI